MAGAEARNRSSPARLHHKGDKMYKKYDELTFADDFMFCHILVENEDLCRELTEMITGRKVREIVKKNP